MEYLSFCRLEEKNQLIEELQTKLDTKLKESSNSSLKWQKEISDATNKIADLTKKCKSLTEELTEIKKQSQEVQELKQVRIKDLLKEIKAVFYKYDFAKPFYHKKI